ncbi:MAG: hypothetical protein AB7I19_12330 [Planctomycetota bacterium]
MAPKSALVLILALAAFPACSAAPTATETTKDGGDAAASKSDDDTDLQGLVADLAEAESELATERIAQDRKKIEAANEVAKAERALAAAERELKVFLEVERKNEEDEARLGLDQDRYQVEHAKDELAELEAMYSQDEFAKTTKELVIKRGRRQLEVAERELGLAQNSFRLKADHEWPERVRTLEAAVADAKVAVETSRMEAREAEESIRLDLVRAQRKVSDAKAAIAKAESKKAKS